MDWHILELPVIVMKDIAHFTVMFLSKESPLNQSPQRLIRYPSIIPKIHVIFICNCPTYTSIEGLNPSLKVLQLQVSWLLWDLTWAVNRLDIISTHEILIRVNNLHTNLPSIALFFYNSVVRRPKLPSDNALVISSQLTYAFYSFDSWYPKQSSCSICQGPNILSLVA